MEVFLIKRDEMTYQEIMRVSCQVETAVRKYKYEKRLLTVIPNTIQLNLKDSYLLNNMEAIVSIMDLYKYELIKIIKEQRETKLQNKRTHTPNYVLRVNDNVAFNLKETFHDLSKCSEEEIEEKVNGIPFALNNNGPVYENSLGIIQSTQYLI